MAVMGSVGLEAFGELTGGLWVVDFWTFLLQFLSKNVECFHWLATRKRGGAKNMGGPGSGRKPETLVPPHRAGRALLKFEALERRKLAVALEVDERTLRRWIAGVGAPNVNQALALEKIAKIPLDFWKKQKTT